MSVKKGDEATRVIELFERMLIFQLYFSGVSKRRIAKIVGKDYNWVIDLVKGVSRKGEGED